MYFIHLRCYTNYYSFLLCDSEELQLNKLTAGHSIRRSREGSKGPGTSNSYLCSLPVSPLGDMDLGYIQSICALEAWLYRLEIYGPCS